MPRQTALQEINEHINYTLQIVSATLLDAEVTVDGSIPRSPCEAFVVFVGDVLSVFSNVLF